MEVATAIGLTLIGTLVILTASGLWIALGLAGIGIVMFYFLLPPMMMRMIEPILFNTVNDFILAAIPLFIFMGSLLYKGDVATKIYKGLGKLVSLLPGGLLQTNIISCAIFGACSGSSLAGAATMGTLAVRELSGQGYQRSTVLGSLAAGGTLATMIPPSILFIIYGSFASESVAKLFIAGIVPALILVGAFMVYIMVLAMLNPEVTPKQPRASFWEILTSLKMLFAPVGLIVAVLGSIYTGVATPTESAAVGSLGALLILAFDGKLKLSVVLEAARMSARTTCMIALLMIGTKIISVALSVLRIPATVSMWIGQLPVDPWMIAVMIVLFYILLGMLIEGTSMFFLTFPVVFPLMMSLGYDPIWFGVMMALFIEMSLITPPIGLNLFIIQQVAGERSLAPVIRGSFPFFLIMVSVTMLFIAFPEIVLWLPNKL
ncbi:MAG: TRAP transporter large permease subunit [Rhodobacteraceae bacterium]|nr:TRAP transporter large permease subunit [Paracoccaceae bacterium]